MKLKHTTAAVETNNVTEGNTFGIKSSPKTFAILSSGLYSNKILAVVRELSCNAYDSHTERNNAIDAGKASKYTAPRDKNLIVHFPTAFDPFFSVRDFGIGLTPEEVENVYTVYFESTKQDSNDYVGALGLGSKSPFSYAKSFNVIATKHGHRVIYTMFINSNGIPQPAILDQGPVESFYMDDEVIPEEEFYDGVEVKVPAEPNDTHSFCECAQLVYQYFAQCPELKNYTGGTIKHYQDGVEEFVSGIYIDDHWYRNGQYAIQGNVAYPIILSENDFKRAVKDIEKFEDQDRPDETLSEETIGNLWNFYYDVFRNYTFFVRFEIGELDVAASREELSYDASTIMAIIVQIKRIYDCIENKFEKHMSKFDTKWDKARELHRLGSYYHNYNLTATENLFRKTRSYLTYLSANYIPQLELDSNDRNVKYHHDYTMFALPKEADFNIRVCGRSSFKRFTRLWYHETNPVNLHSLAANNRVGAMADEVQIVVNDTARGGATMAKAYFQEVSSKSQCILFEPDKLGDITEIQLFINKINAKMDNPGFNIVYLSKVKEEYPDLTKRTTRPKSNIGYYETCDEYTNVYAIRSEIPEEFSTDTIVYIPFKQQKPASNGIDFDQLNSLGDNPGVFQSPYTVTATLKKIARYKGGDMPTVVGLNQNMLRQVGDYENWISADEYIVQEFHRKFSKQSQRDKVVEKLKSKLRTNEIVDNVEWPFCTDTTSKIVNHLSQDPELSEVHDIITTLSAGKETTTSLEDFYTTFYQVPGVEYDAEWFNNKFSILSMVESERSWYKIADEDVIKVVNYIKTCTLNGESK